MDGYYTYSYECEDTLGQTLEGSKVIRIDGDMSISNPQPNRTINYKDNIILSIDTLLAGTCKYSVDEPLYAAMTQEFNSSTSGTHQTANFSAPGTNFYRFYTACDFLQEGIHKITEANTADEIRFAVDLAPPTAHAYNDATGEPFDFSSTYQEAKIRFNCSDQLIWWEAHDWSFGCNKTFYSVETGCDLPTFQRNRFIEQTTPFVKRLDTTGTNKICYFAQDKGGNNETIQSQTVKIDNTPPEFTIEIENVQNNILGFGNYKINIATNETAEITSIMFEDLQYLCGI